MSDQADHRPYPSDTVALARSKIAALRRELALAQEARLAAELRAEGLRGALVDLCREWGVMSDPHSRDHSQALERLIAAPPPALGPLRSCIAGVDAVIDAVAEFGIDPDAIGEAFHHAEAAHDDLLTAYPWLDPGAEPAGEVPRG